MGIFGGGGSNKPTELNAVRVSQSVLGYAVPSVMGTAKIQQSLLWIDGFIATQESAGGGKGGGGKGSTFYQYTVNVVAALCNGPVKAIGDAWSGQSWLGNPNAAESYTISGTGSYTPTNASSLYNDQGVGLLNTYSATYSDLGAPSATVLSGSDYVAMQRVDYTSVYLAGDMLAGQYAIDPSGIYYLQPNPPTGGGTYGGGTNPGNGGQTVQISYSFNLTNINQQENDIVPAGKTISVGGTFQFGADLGVKYTTGPDEGHALTKVSGTPTATGTYSVSGSGPATYHFATGDIGAEVTITFQIVDSAAVEQGASDFLNFTLFEGTQGQSPWSVLTASFPQAAIGYTFKAFVGYNPMALGTAAQIQQNVFEVITPDAYGSGIQDCNPVQCLTQVLTNPVWGLGTGAVPFPATVIDSGVNGTWGGSYPATKVHTTGGTTLYKLFWGSTLSINGQIYVTSCNITNSGLKTVRVSDNFGNHQDVAPGVTTAVSIVGTGNGISDYQLLFNALNASDSLTFTVWNPSIQAGYNTPNLITALNVASGWGLGTGATVTFTTDRTIGSSAWNWFSANSFFISPVLDQQDTAATTMSKWLEAGMCAAFMSEGLLKLVPYGDTTSAGNGCTWLAPTEFAVALDDSCFVAKDGEDPVKIERSAWQDAMNTVQVQWDNRSNQYSPEITQESDQQAINRFGTRIEEPQNWDFIHTLAAATFAASMRVKRSVYIRNTYTFTLPFIYSYVEPMDVVTISTTSIWAQGLNNANLGVMNLPVRVSKVVDDPVSGLKITAEDYPFGAHQPTIYNKAIAAGDVVANAFADPGTSEVVMFEATDRLTGYQGNQIWIGATGAGESYGSTNVWVSQDGTKYLQVGTITSPARLGTLNSMFASGSDPDATNSLVVTLAENSPALDSGTTTDADSGNTLCFVDGEIIAYSGCSVTGQNQYTMGTYIRRGEMGSTISSHSTDSLFLRLDDAIFKYTYDPRWTGQTLYFKFQAVNSFGNNPQPLSSLTPVTFTVPGQNPGTIDASSGLLLALDTSIGAGPLGWTPAAQTA